MTDFQVRPGAEIRRVAAELREIDKKLPTKFRAELRKAAKPAVQKAKRAVRRMPTGGSGTTGLRRRIARGVRVQASTKAGVRIVTAMPRGEEMLPRGMDSRTRTGGWRHPVFGSLSVWVEQQGGAWFMASMAAAAPEAARRMQGVLDEAAETIARAGGPST